MRSFLLLFLPLFETWIGQNFSWLDIRRALNIFAVFCTQLSMNLMFKFENEPVKRMSNKNSTDCFREYFDIIVSRNRALSEVAIATTEVKHVLKIIHGLVRGYPWRWAQKYILVLLTFWLDEEVGVRARVRCVQSLRAVFCGLAVLIHQPSNISSALGGECDGGHTVHVLLHNLVWKWHNMDIGGQSVSCHYSIAHLVKVRDVSWTSDQWSPRLEWWAVTWQQFVWQLRGPCLVWRRLGCYISPEDWFTVIILVCVCEQLCWLRMRNRCRPVWTLWWWSPVRWLPGAWCLHGHSVYL